MWFFFSSHTYCHATATPPQHQRLVQLSVWHHWRGDVVRAEVSCRFWEGRNEILLVLCFHSSWQIDWTSVENNILRKMQNLHSCGPSSRFLVHVAHLDVHISENIRQTSSQLFVFTRPLQAGMPNNRLLKTLRCPRSCLPKIACMHSNLVCFRWRCLKLDTTNSADTCTPLACCRNPRISGSHAFDYLSWHSQVCFCSFASHGTLDTCRGQFETVSHNKRQWGVIFTNQAELLRNVNSNPQTSLCLKIRNRTDCFSGLELFSFVSPKTLGVYSLDVSPKLTVLSSFLIGNNV